jgi:hypothetical protein
MDTIAHGLHAPAPTLRPLSGCTARRAQRSGMATAAPVA